MVMNKPPFCKGVDNQILLLDWRVWGSHDDHVPTHEVALQVLLHVLLDHWLQLPIKYNRKGSICIIFHVFSLYVSPTEKEGEISSYQVMVCLLIKKAESSSKQEGVQSYTNWIIIITIIIINNDKRSF